VLEKSVLVTVFDLTALAGPNRHDVPLGDAENRFPLFHVRGLHDPGWERENVVYICPVRGFDGGRRENLGEIVDRVDNQQDLGDTPEKSISVNSKLGD